MLLIQNQHNLLQQQIDENQATFNTFGKSIQAMADAAQNLKQEEQAQATQIIQEITAKFIEARKKQAQTVDAVVALAKEVGQVFKLTQSINKNNLLGDFLPAQLSDLLTYLNQHKEIITAEQWPTLAATIHAQIQEIYAAKEQKTKTLQEKMDIALAYQDIAFQLEELHKKFPQETALKKHLQAKTQQYQQLLAVGLNTENGEITPDVVLLTRELRKVDPYYLPNTLPNYMPHPHIPRKGEDPDTLREALIKKRLAYILMLQASNKILKLSKEQQIELDIKIALQFREDLRKGINPLKDLNYKDKKGNPITGRAKDELVARLTNDLLGTVQWAETNSMPVTYQAPGKRKEEWPKATRNIADLINEKIYLNNEQRQGLRAFYHNGGLYRIDTVSLVAEPIDTTTGTAKGKKGEVAFVIGPNGELSLLDHISRDFNGFDLDENPNLKYLNETVKGKTSFHSSARSGTPVLGAGLMQVRQGKITAIKNSSGHYKPGLDNFWYTLQFLLERGVNLNHTQITYFTGDKTYEFNGIQEFHKALPVLAVLAGLPDLLKALHEKPDDQDFLPYTFGQDTLLNKPNKNGVPPILAFAKKRDWRTVYQLLRLGANNCVLDTNGDNLAHIAARQGEWNVVKGFVDIRGFDVNATNIAGETIFTIAQQHGVDLSNFFTTLATTNNEEETEKQEVIDLNQVPQEKVIPTDYQAVRTEIEIKYNTTPSEVKVPPKNKYDSTPTPQDENTSQQVEKPAPTTNYQAVPQVHAVPTWKKGEVPKPSTPSKMTAEEVEAAKKTLNEKLNRLKIDLAFTSSNLVSDIELTKKKRRFLSSSLNNDQISLLNHARQRMDVHRDALALIRELLAETKTLAVRIKQSDIKLDTKTEQEIKSKQADLESLEKQFKQLLIWVTKNNLEPTTKEVKTVVQELQKYQKEYTKLSQGKTSLRENPYSQILTLEGNLARLASEIQKIQISIQEMRDHAGFNDNETQRLNELGNTLNVLSKNSSQLSSQMEKLQLKVSGELSTQEQENNET